MSKSIIRATAQDRGADGRNAPGAFASSRPSSRISKRKFATTRPPRSFTAKRGAERTWRDLGGWHDAFGDADPRNAPTQGDRRRPVDRVQRHRKNHSRAHAHREPTAVFEVPFGRSYRFLAGRGVCEEVGRSRFSWLQRYTADPFEWSAVDAPCLPSALVDSMKGQHVTLMKAGGSTEEIPLVIPTSDARRVRSDHGLLKRAVSDRTRRPSPGLC